MNSRLTVYTHDITKNCNTVLYNKKRIIYSDNIQKMRQAQELTHELNLIYSKVR